MKIVKQEQKQMRMKIVKQAQRQMSLNSGWHSFNISCQLMNLVH
uniref:Uncharacterized protein n=1 Tax=Arundo donax TaxID=35708 RepID=A0A0A9F4F5_ARUDO